MLNKCFVAIAILMANPAFASAQDIFWSFSPTEVVTSIYPYSSPVIPTSACIFSDGDFGFDGLDLEFTIGDGFDVIFTGGEAFNPSFNVIGSRTFDSSEITFDASGTSGRLFSENITQNGVVPSVSPLFNPSFEPNVGPNGAVLLARVDFDTVNGVGLGLLGGLFEYPDNGCPINLSFALGPQGAFKSPDIILNPSFGSADLQFSRYGCPSDIGDVNHSGTVDFLDISPFIAILSSSGYQREADCNGDGVVNFLDIAPFVALL